VSNSIISEKLKAYNEGKPVPLYQKAAAGAPRAQPPRACALVCFSGTANRNWPLPRGVQA
jgi:hypothetical protein